MIYVQLYIDRENKRDKDGVLNKMGTSLQVDELLTKRN
jgi:hypothetical protein